MHEIIAQRRSVRFFKKDPIAESDMKEILPVSAISTNHDGCSARILAASAACSSVSFASHG